MTTTAPHDVSTDTTRLPQHDSSPSRILVMPVYNRSFPASLKNAIDWFHDEWAATPVGFVSYGGRTGGIEAVEQLRTIFVALSTMTIRNVLYFPNFWEVFDDDGAPVNTAAMSSGSRRQNTQLT